jgi:hypothetical protein
MSAPILTDEDFLCGLRRIRTIADRIEHEAQEEEAKRIAKINREAVAAIVLAMSEAHKGTAEEAEEYARAIVTALAKGLIPHCKIEY